MTKHLKKPISGNPALLAIVGLEWVEQAMKEFGEGKREIYFGTSATGMGPALRVPVQRVYFKTEGSKAITFQADLVEVTRQNVPNKRLNSMENESDWKYYYGFGKIAPMVPAVALSALRYFSTGNQIQNAVPGSCLIHDPIS
ncbi:MAG: hypothetical protein NTV52_07965 [Acidobacteria bacterium]|nr:hypothetical protein [Acidobacteriota bacterium]